MMATRTTILALGVVLILVGGGCHGRQQAATDAGKGPAVDFVAQGKEQFKAGQYDLAEQSFRQGLQQHPDALEATYYLGRCAFQKGAYDQAAASFTEVVTKHPKSADSWAWLGQSYEALKRGPDALTAYKNAQQLDPKNDIARKGIAKLGPGKRIAITIDDGPSLTYTLKAMDECEKHGGRLTFFVVGTWLERDPQIIKLMQKRGHQIGNHTYEHVDLTKQSEDKIRWQLGHTNDIIVKQGGAKPTFMRPPYGSHNALVDRICAELGLKVVLWDIDTDDWRSDRSGEQTVQYVLSHAKPDAVVLMHQVHNTYTVLDRIFDGLAKAGFTCVRLDELPRYPKKMGT
jgi:peptidoglycan/xylan/chitin deacetylase (PgdA/CDA1 family)